MEIVPRPYTKTASCSCGCHPPLLDHKPLKSRVHDRFAFIPPGGLREWKQKAGLTAAPCPFLGTTVSPAGKGSQNKLRLCTLAPAIFPQAPGASPRAQRNRGTDGTHLSSFVFWSRNTPGPEHQFSHCFALSVQDANSKQFKWWRAEERN